MDKMNAFATANKEMEKGAADVLVLKSPTAKSDSTGKASIASVSEPDTEIPNEHDSVVSNKKPVVPIPMVSSTKVENIFTNDPELSSSKEEDRKDSAITLVSNGVLESHIKEEERIQEEDAVDGEEADTSPVEKNTTDSGTATGNSGDPTSTAGEAAPVDYKSGEEAPPVEKKQVKKINRKTKLQKAQSLMEEANKLNLGKRCI
jgi:hypothetical protein